MSPRRSPRRWERRRAAVATPARAESKSRVVTFMVGVWMCAGKDEEALAEVGRWPHPYDERGHDEKRGTSRKLMCACIRSAGAGVR